MMLATEYVLPQNQRWSIHAVNNRQFYTVEDRKRGNECVCTNLEVAVFALYRADVILEEEIDEVLEEAELFFSSMEVEQDESIRLH